MLQILIRTAIAKIITQLFIVRVHAGIARKPWARLWYLCRALDSQGEGKVNPPVDLVCQLLVCSKSTLYEWLRVGKQEAGAFRYYRFDMNTLFVYQGGLAKVCAALGLESWGATGEVSLLDASRKLRASATAIVTANLQKKSHYAARRSLKPRERQSYSPPTADALLAEGKRSSQNPAKGQVPFLLYVGERVAFVSKSFVPHGASQRSIGAELGISERTVRRHHRAQGLERRQIAQAKHAYQLIDAAIQWEAEQCYAEPDIWYQRRGDNIQLFEPNGVTSSHREGGHAITRGRLFRYWGKTWLYRCNLYALCHIRLVSMRAARRQYKAYCDSQCDSSQSLTSGGRGLTLKKDKAAHREKTVKIHKM